MDRVDHVADWASAQAERARVAWTTSSLARQFFTCATLVMLPAMLVIGLWVSNRIREGVTSSSGTSAALYMENYVEPLIQELATGDTISSDSAVQLGRLLSETSLGQNVLTFKIWGPDGLIVASSRPELIGHRFEPSSGLKAAWQGTVKAEFDHLHDAENIYEKASGLPLLEVYFPLRERGSPRIIAVGEFYEKAHRLERELKSAQLLSWLVVGAVTLSMLGALSVIVRRGSRTIEFQRASLEQRVGELSRLLAENRELRARAHRASSRASESNEVYLKRLGADLHDGPAQLVSLALLRLEEASPEAPRDGQPAGRTTVRSVLTDALNDIRNIAEGLAAPEIDGIPLEAALIAAVSRHEKLTSTRVEQRCGGLPDPVSPALKLCAYRFVQEGLSNAFRHAGGSGQTVIARAEGDTLVLEVCDLGGGTAKRSGNKRRGLGLRGLTDRIESLGGSLLSNRRPNGGTCLTARLPLAAEVIEDV